MTAPVVHSLREQIREHIVEGIVSGRWKPGERIVERRIADRAGGQPDARARGAAGAGVAAADRVRAEQGRAGAEPDRGRPGGELPGPGRPGADRGGAGGAAAGEDCSALEPHVAALYEADRHGGRRRRRCGTRSPSTASWCARRATACCCTPGRGWASRCSRRCRSAGWARCSSRTRRSTRSWWTRSAAGIRGSRELVKAHVLGCAPRGLSARLRRGQRPSRCGCPTCARHTASKTPAPQCPCLRRHRRAYFLVIEKFCP